MSSPSCGPCACVHAFLEAGWQGQRGLKVGLWGSELNDPQIHAAGLFSPIPPGGAASHRRNGRRGWAGGGAGSRARLLRAGETHLVPFLCARPSWGDRSRYKVRVRELSLLNTLPTWTLTWSPGQDGGRVLPPPQEGQTQGPGSLGSPHPIPFIPPDLSGCFKFAI